MIAQVFEHRGPIHANFGDFDLVIQIARFVLQKLFVNLLGVLIIERSVGFVLDGLGDLGHSLVDFGQIVRHLRTILLRRTSGNIAETWFLAGLQLGIVSDFSLAQLGEHVVQRASRSS